jgi:potassium efflux system protein
MRLVSLIVMVLAGCTPAEAQTELDVGAQQIPTAEPGGEVLSPAEVAAAAQHVTTALYRLRARIHHTRDLAHHQAVIESVAREVRRLERLTNLDALDTQPRRELRNLRELWTELGARIEANSEELATTASALEEESAQIRAADERWERTAAAAERDGYPEAARARIEEVRALLAEVGVEVDAHLEPLLAAQTQLATHAIQAGDILSRVDDAIERKKERVLVRTHAPGMGGLEGAERVTLAEQLDAAAVHHARSLKRFASHLKKRGWLLSIAVIGLLAFVYWLRREHRIEKPTGAAARALAHPIVVAIFVALLLVRPLHPLAPRAVLELAQLLAIGPLLTLDPSTRARNVTRLVCLLYAVDWVRLLFDENHAEHRVLVTLTAALATLGLAYCAHKADGPARALWGAASFGAAVSLGACVMGYVPLSALLIEGVVASAFVAAALMVLHRVLGGLVDAALTTRFALGTVLGRHSEETRTSVRRASRLLLGASWAWIALDYFGLRSAFVKRSMATMRESVELGELEISVGEILAFAIGIWAAVLVSRFLARTLQEDVAPRLGMGPGVPAAVALVVRYTVLALGFVLAASAAGIGIAQLSLFAGALGVGVGFGLQNIVSNFVSGLLLVFERPVKVGDTIDLEGRRGVITEIGVRSSTIRAINGADILIPNSKLIEGTLVNWTHQDAMECIEFPIGVAYGTDIRSAQRVLIEAAASVPGALVAPAPEVLLRKFGDSSIDFEVRVWIAEAQNEMAARSALGFAIHDALEGAGIEIPYPTSVQIERAAD